MNRYIEGGDMEGIRLIKKRSKIQIEEDPVLKDIKIDLRKLKGNESSAFYKQLCELHPCILKMRATPRWLGPIGYRYHLLTQYGELYNLKTKVMIDILDGRELIKLEEEDKHEGHVPDKLLDRVYGTHIDTVVDEDKKSLEFLGYPKHMITRDGRLWSWYSNRYVRPFHENGYYRYPLWSNGTANKKLFGHVMVAKAFIPNPNPDTDIQVNHIRPDRSCNFDFNLEWTSALANTTHAIKLGRRNINKNGEQTIHVSKEQAKEICKLLSEGIATPAIHKRTGVPISSIKNIKGGKIHKDVSKDYTWSVREMGAKATEEDALLIAKYIVEGYRNIEIAEMTGHDKGLISSIKRRRYFPELLTDHVWYNNHEPPSERIHAICTAIVAGEPSRKIAKRLNVAASLVDAIKRRDEDHPIIKKMGYYDIIKQYNYQGRQQVKDLPVEIVKAICKRLEEGMSIINVAKEFNRGVKSIKAILQRQVHQDISKNYTWSEAV